MSRRNKRKSRTTLEKMSGQRIKSIDLSDQRVTIITNKARFVSGDAIIVDEVINHELMIGAIVSKGTFIDLDKSRFFVIKTSRGLLMIKYDSPTSFNMTIFSN